MGAIQTSISLADNISAVLNNITNAMNMTLCAFQDVQDTSSRDINVDSFGAIRDQINAATIGIRQFEDELSSIQPKAVEVTPVWDIESRIAIFQNTGLDRLNLEMGSLNDITNEILQSQQRIGEQALNMELLPPNASGDINATNQRIAELGQMLSGLQDVDASLLDSDSVNRMNSEMENMRSNMNSIVNIQESMNAAVEQGDFSILNAGFSQINDIAESVEKRVRTSMSAIQEMNNIEWNTPQNIEIYGGNGLDRYRQEIESTNNMLSSLTATQQRIGQNANAMRILPPQALNEINSMVSRIQALRSQIEQVQKSRIAVVGVEQANAEVEHLRQQLSQAVQVQENMNSAIDSMDVSGANAAYNQLNSIISTTERSIRDNVNEQQAFNNEIRNGENAANGLKGAIAGIMGIFTLRAAKNWVDDSIDMTNQQIRAEQQLANVLANQGASEADFLALKQQAATIQAQGMYDKISMTGAAAEFSSFVKDAEAVQVMMDTLTNYAAGMSGGEMVDYQQMVNYATQLGKAFDGNIQGISLKGFALSEAQKEIIENGTDMEKALAIQGIIAEWEGLYDAMCNTPTGHLAQMKNSVNEIRASFGAQLLPVILLLFGTFQEHMPQIEQLFFALVPAIQFVIQTIGQIINAAFAVHSFFADNWPRIAPIILGIAGAFAAWKIATMLQTTAQWGLNAAMWASPVTWLVIGILAIAAAIIIGVNAMNNLAGTSYSAAGVIMGCFYTLGAFIYNSFIVPTWNRIASFINFFANVFHDPVASIQILFLDLTAVVLNQVAVMARGIEAILNKIPGVAIDITSGIDKKLSEIEMATAHVKSNSEWVEVAKKLNHWEYVDAFSAGYKKGESIESGFGDFFDRGIDVIAASDFVVTNFDGEGHIGGIANDTANIAGNTTAMKNTGEEDLKYLRDIAERDTINKFTIAEIKFDMGGVVNNVNSEVDLDGIIDYIGEGMMERIEMVAEGVYA